MVVVVVAGVAAAAYYLAPLLPPFSPFLFYFSGIPMYIIMYFKYFNEKNGYPKYVI